MLVYRDYDSDRSTGEAAYTPLKEAISEWEHSELADRAWSVARFGGHCPSTIDHTGTARLRSQDAEALLTVVRHPLRDIVELWEAAVAAATSEASSP